MAFDPFVTPIDHFLLSGQKSPGTARIVGASSPRKWDERAGYGLSGSFSVYLGRRLAKFDAVITLVDSADWAAWQAFKPLVDRAPNGKRPRALDIWHPWLADLDIKAAGVEDVLQPDEPDDGSKIITIKFIEFRAPRITLAKPEAASRKESNDPVDKLIEKLTDQVQELAK